MKKHPAFERLHITTPAESRRRRETIAEESIATCAGHAIIEDALLKISPGRPARISTRLLGPKGTQLFLKAKYEAAGWSWVYCSDPRDGDYIEIGGAS